MTNKKFNLKKVLLLAAILGASVHECSNFLGFGAGGGRSGSQSVAVTKPSTPEQLAAIATMIQLIDKSGGGRRTPTVAPELEIALGPEDANQCKNQLAVFFEFLRSNEWPKDCKSLPQKENETQLFCYVREATAPCNQSALINQRSLMPLEKYSVRDGKFVVDDKPFGAFVKEFLQKSSSTMAVLAIQSLPIVLLHEIYESMPGVSIQITKYMEDKMIKVGFSTLLAIVTRVIDESTAKGTSPYQILMGKLKDQFDGSSESALASNISKQIESVLSSKREDHILLMRKGNDGTVHVGFLPGNKEEYKANADKINSQFDNTGKIAGTVLVSGFTFV